MTQIIDLGKLRFYWAGEYNSATVYEVNDVVKYGGNVYVYTYTLGEAAHTPTDTTYWALMISGLKFEGEYNNGYNLPSWRWRCLRRYCLYLLLLIQLATCATKWYLLVTICRWYSVRRKLFRGYYLPTQ
jgi:hypothetical protein